MRFKSQVIRGYSLRDGLFALCKDMKAVNDAASTEELQRALVHLEQTFAELVETHVKLDR
jgi:hypothetical protein